VLHILDKELLKLFELNGAAMVVIHRVEELVYVVFGRLSLYTFFLEMQLKQPLNLFSV
jgi:hypothetical protein